MFHILFHFANLDNMIIVFPSFSRKILFPPQCLGDVLRISEKKQPAGPPSLKEKSVYALNFGYNKNTYDEKYLFFRLVRKLGQVQK